MPDAAASANGAMETTVTVPNMSGYPKVIREKIIKQNRKILMARIKPDDQKGSNEIKDRYEALEWYLGWLDTECVITPEIKRICKLDFALKEIFEKPENKFPDKLQDMARALFKRFEDEHWGQDDVVDDENMHKDPNAVPTDSNAHVTSQPTSSNRQLTVQKKDGEEMDSIAIPANNDPIFGVGGLMHGVILRSSATQKRFVLNHQVPHKSPKIYGDNGIALGTWYPFQVNALHHGAHGSGMAGISGNVIDGAYSIVVSGYYGDLDRDNGDTIYYSGSNSHDNTDKNQPAPSSTGTKALKASFNTRRPVRVLRSGGHTHRKGSNNLLPEIGLRYDGLYRVTGLRNRTNKKGGLYEQFTLERIPGQTPIAQLKRDCPNQAQKDVLRKLGRY
ncbi:hypothetical protein F5Y16DRAFT_423461 [Xylariaceae sp. FL0255]|nr:hypothetical protein F5Y16DRAFT_423461 [Xylariaceae sp. FL0255]